MISKIEISNARKKPTKAGLLIFLLTYVTPWSTVLLEKLTDFQLVK
jgi:hypothetical protein